MIKASKHSRKGLSRPDRALSNEQLRRLVVDITNRSGVEAFVRRMMKLHDALRAGRIGQMARIAAQSKNKSYQRVMATVSSALKEKRVNVALNIAFFASLYAYENSPDHGREFMCYLDRFRSDTS